MNVKTETTLLLVIVLPVVLLAACRAATEVEPEATTPALAATEERIPEDSTSPLTIPGASPDTSTPAGVVDAFYTWYLDTEGADDFTVSPYLSRRQIRAVRQAMEAEHLGADPFLMAQEVPRAIRVEEVSSGNATARVVLHLYFNPDFEESMPSDLTIDLLREDGAWKIDRIQPGSPLTPEGVVQLFYNWYFEYGDSERTVGVTSYALLHARTPLADRAYRSSPYLTPALIAEVDGLLELEEGPAAYDPFLLAQNHPTGYYVMKHLLHVAGSEARAPVQLMYGSQQTVIDVIVRQENGTWRMDEIQGEVPDDATAAAQVVALFSSLYFERWYAYADERGLPHAGDVDLAPFLSEVQGIYRTSPYVSAGFAVASLDLISGRAVATDPFLQSTHVPAMMEIDGAWAEGDHAEVRVVQAWAEEHEKRPLTVTLVRQSGRWQIESVVPLAEGAAVAAAPKAEMHPADVVRAFFAGYVAQGGYAAGAYRGNSYLAPAYVETVENDVGYYRSLGIPVDEYDPILHSARSVLPGGIRVEVSAVVVDQERHLAVARADRIYENGSVLPLTVFLMRDWDNRWTIQDTGAVDPTGLWEGGEDVPEELWRAMQVAVWYDWAIAYSAQSDKVNELPQHIPFDFEAAGGITFCTKTWPLGFTVESVFLEQGVEGGHRRARMVLKSTEVHALVTLELEQREWLWVIVAQQCGDTPAGRAQAFYTSYLGNRSDRTDAAGHARGDYLTGDLAMSLDSAPAAALDPLTLAAKAPRWLDARAGPAENSAIVSLTLADGALHEIEATFVFVDGRWLLSQVTPAD